MARLDEVADGIYKISTLETETEFQFSQFLTDDELPALVHTGMWPHRPRKRRLSAASSRSMRSILSYVPSGGAAPRRSSTSWRPAT
jgi:hypothetical protein